MQIKSKLNFKSFDNFSIVYLTTAYLRIVLRFIWRRLFYFELNRASAQLNQRKIAIFWISIVMKYKNKPFADHPNILLSFIIMKIFMQSMIGCRFLPKDCTRLYPFAWDNQWRLKSKILIDKLFLMEHRCFYSRYENKLLA